MPPNAMDAHGSFVFLQENVPQWIKELDALASHASAKHTEFAAEYARLAARSNPRKHRTSSMHSHHPDQYQQADLPDPVDPTAATSGPLPDPAEISPPETGNKSLLAQMQRKRKLDSSIRTGGSGPPRHRSKQMVVIYYDAYLQDQLERLVKNIGAARNNLRKGKMSRSLERGLQLPSLRGDRSSDRNFSYAFAGFRLTAATGISSIPTKVQPLGQGDPDIGFMDVDKQLQLTQDFCETASHQVLRDGDCAIELKNARQNLETALDIAKSALAQLEQERTERTLNNASPTESEVTLVDENSPVSIPASKAHAALPSVLENRLPSISSGVVEIEIDDNESNGSSIIIDITKFRSPGARNILRA